MSIRPDEFLENTSWMRGLARSLVSDESEVEDLLQEAYLASTEGPPGRPRSTTSWLGGVVRNLVTRSRRSESRRRRREERSARPEADASIPADLVERADLHRRVVEEVLLLDEPYRSTVLLRYFEDRSAVEIAARDGIPQSTVRIRLHRAREQLRRRLDHVYGGERGTWRALLLPLAVPPAGQALSSAAGGTAGAQAAALSTGLSAGSAAAKALILGGTIMTQSTLVTAVAVGLITLAAGFGIGRLASRIGPEEAMSRFQLVEADRVASLESRNRQASAELDKLRAERGRAGEERDALLAKVTKLEADLKSAREGGGAVGSAPAGRGAPVAFGKYAELEGIQKADWPALGAAVKTMEELMVKLFDSVKEGGAVDPELQKQIQAENNKLVTLAASVMGKIPTHSPINGEFTHPIVLANLLGSVLEAGQVPLSKNQSAELARLGGEYEKAYAGRQEAYTKETPGLEKFIDELELKKDCMQKIRDSLTDEQRAELTPPELQDMIPLDVLSPGVSTQLMAQSKTYGSAEDVRAKFPGALLKHFDLDPSLAEPLKEAFDGWYRDVEPLLTPRSKEGGLRLAEAAAAGRAQATLLKKILELPELSDKARAAILADQSWYIPLVVEGK